ncbi:50S ribosomal protein L11 methyltransferase [Lacticaseibacillus nasuensis]|uniref:50S ribosomal protein L11 methyltransferase n=1 Tax=Lacticaseibacillus nasuensis TaxID=944671 RepID=UPI00224808F2|nr:50S ribosomal protein L11 methyltransferase [Lacticaseibacillus nasuensis]MCX2455607.1 50S ribosomal protein L11 methyltransferase [Lacticaseibacillus nasuensis]
MDWLAITIDTSSEAVSAASNFLLTAGAEGIQIVDAADPVVPGVPHRASGAAVTGFFAPGPHTAELVTTLQAQVAQLPQFGLALGNGTVTTSGVNEADWATAWEQYYHPVRVTRYMTIAPAWGDYAPQQAGEIVVKLDPGLAFGTGSHPTTQLMIRLMEATLRGGETVIDVGTGSGVLALVAADFGAARVLATDVDAVAVTNATRNLAMNPPAPITVQASDLLATVSLRADVILANILAEVLLPLVPQLPAHLLPGGQVILSGIYHDQLGKIQAALSAAHLTITTLSRQGDWYGLVAEVQA